jgi:hypothetical protein
MPTAIHSISVRCHTDKSSTIWQSARMSIGSAGTAIALIELMDWHSIIESANMTNIVNKEFWYGL